MPEPTGELRSETYRQLREEIIQNINNLKGLVPILKSLRSEDNVSMAEKVELMRLVFVTESKTPKYDLITYLWNFLKILYNDMDKLILRLVPTIAIEKGTELTEKQALLFKEITTRLYYVMVYMKDSGEENVEVMCKNVLLLSKYFFKEQNYSEFFNLAKETFFNPKHMYQLKIFSVLRSPAHDIFLEHYLSSIWGFRDVSESSLSAKGVKSPEMLEKLFGIFIFYVNHETRNPPEDTKFRLTDKLISVLMNLSISQGNKDVSNSIKCLYSLVQIMKADSGQETAIKGLLQYGMRITEKTILNSVPIASDTLATIGLILEKNSFFSEDANLKAISLEGLRNLLQFVKLSVSLNVEPTKFLCELKDCVKGAKKHTITNLTRFAQKLFISHVQQLEESQQIDEVLLVTVTQLIIFHFHVLERLPCLSRVANEHNDIRRLYSTFAHRSKTNPPPSVVKIFEILLKYAMQRNLNALVNPLATLKAKYYAELNDQENCNRIDWLNLICLHGDALQSSAFNNYCYNWAVKKQMLVKEEVQGILKSMKAQKFDFQTEIIPKDVNARKLFLSILESVASPNYKAFRVIQECLVELLMEDSNECSSDNVNVLFYATENQILDYKETIERNSKFFADLKDNPENLVAKAVLHSLTYQVYVAELKKDLKSLDINDMDNRKLNLSMLSMKREIQELESLRKSLDCLVEAKSGEKLPFSLLRQVTGTLKRNIRFFQLAGLEFEEVSSCRLLYDIGKETKDAECCVLAMANLMNHVHFIIKDEKCRQAFPKLIRVITGEGSDLITSQLKKLPEVKDSLQTLIVFGMGNMIKLNADLGRREKCYDYLEYLKLKIDEANQDKEEASNLADMQYNLISYQLFLKFSQKSKVNHLMVARELFSAVRLLQKASDLYALYLYDVLAELFCFSVPRYETKELDYYICIVLKYFTGIGSVTRILDVLLIYANWTLCCEKMEKCLPAMEYVADILTRTEKETRRISSHTDEKIKGDEDTEKIDEEESLKKISLAIKSWNTKSSVRLAICSFKLNCLLARKHSIDRCYDQSQKLYEQAWADYDALNDKITNFSLKMDFQQFYVSVLFQLSTVYYKQGLTKKSLKCYETTTMMISDIRVNRIALVQESHFQEMIFKSESSTVITATTTNRTNVLETCLKEVTKKDSPVSPNRLEMAMLMNDKKSSGRSSKKKTSNRKDSNEGTPSKSRRGRPSTKTPAKSLKIKVEPVETLPSLDENSSVISNIPKSITKETVEEETKKKSTTRRIPVRTISTKDALKGISSSLAKSKLSSPVEVTPSLGTRKTNRRLL